MKESYKKGEGQNWPGGDESPFKGVTECGGTVEDFGDAEMDVSLTFWTQKALLQACSECSGHKKMYLPTY